MSEISKKVIFRSVNAAALMQQVAGSEAPYPVYRFTNKYKYERPQSPGRPYRWISS